MLSISVLGPVEVRRAGELVSVPAGKTSELLVRLALEAGVVVRSERLVDDLWAADAVHTRRNTLQSKVAKLRRALGDPAALVSGAGGYALVVGPLDVDALAVLRHTSEAARLFEAGEDRAAADLCESTLEMLRGDLLVAAGDGDWVLPHRARLEEARMALLETALSSRARLGESADLIGDLEAAVDAYPFQESLWSLLITALYRSGRQADALAAYQRLRTRLADDLGLEPGPQLQALEQRILVHDASLRPTELFAGGGNLPSMSDGLVGRDAEVSALVALLTHARLVVVVGPGGIGKTALAIATARNISKPGGVWLARLETAASSDDVTDAVVAAMSLPGEAALVERLRHSEALLLLDNCEHVVDAAADLTSRLLDATPGLQMLCTSQVPLDVDGESVFELAPLSLDDAVQLFTMRATAQRGTGYLAQADDAVAELCRSLDGLPLAIELAAARTKTLSIDEISRRLDDRFNVLSDPTSRKPERRRALRATIGWSYELLFPDDQRGLWALATFSGGAPLAAVEAVLEALEVPAQAAIDVIGRLAGRSLVITEPGHDPPRYRLLDSIRAFALEAMDAAGLAHAAHTAHARWFVAAAASSTQGVRSADQATHLAFVRSERANIDVALAWWLAHDPVVALALVNGFGWAWVVLGDSRAAQRILAALDAAGETALPRDRASALLLAAWIEASTDALEPARHHIGLASQIAESQGDDGLRARCSYFLAYVVSHQGSFREAIALTDRSRELLLTLDGPWVLAANALFALRAAISAGDEPLAVTRAAHVADALSQVDDPWLHVRADAMFGELARLQRRFDDAVERYARAAETSRALGFLQTEAYQVASLGRVQCQAGDYGAGAASLQLAVDKAETIGDVRMAALARVHLGRVLRALGDDVGARAALESAAAWHRESGGGEQAALGECLLAAMDAADAVPDARQRLSVILDAARLRDEPHVEVFALDALARIVVADGDREQARALVDEADRRMDAASHFIGDRDRVDARAVRARSGSATSVRR